MATGAEPAGPDLAAEGVDASQLDPGTMVEGHVGDTSVVLCRTDDGVYAIGGRCTHYGGALGQGYFDGSTVRCPRHHACFSIRTGEAVRAPALNPVTVYSVEERDGRYFVTSPIEVTPTRSPVAEPPSSVVIVGAGAAGEAAAETLRREGYEGPVVLLGRDEAPPVDRPNLSKDYLAGNAPEEWIPLRSEQWYRDHDIDLRLDHAVTSIDHGERTVTLSDGTTLGYGALLLATGADPIHLPIPGADQPHVHYLRTLADSRAIIAAAERASSAVVVGASFIGLEVAAALRARELAVHVVAPEPVPMARVLGDDIGRFVQSLHEDHGVVFHLGRKPDRIEAGTVVLDDGTTVDAGLVVMGVGVRPVVSLAEDAGLDVDRGVIVDQYLATSAPGIWAAGDIASWPDPRVGRIRVEHWAVAQRQGQIAAKNILGRQLKFDDVPFFWSEHYDVTIDYVGHAEGWDEVAVAGSVADGDFMVGFVQDGRTLATASSRRQQASLESEVALERGDQGTLDRLTGRS